MQLSKNYIVSILKNKCPRCRTGNLFVKKNPYNLKYTTLMVENCPVCNQKTELEIGFYYGTGYVSYALTIACIVSFFIIWKIFIGFTLNVKDSRIYYCLFSNIFLILLLQPFIMRYSRTMWISWFVKYDPNINYKLSE